MIVGREDWVHALGAFYDVDILSIPLL